MAFYQRKGSTTYHTKTTCSRVPGNVRTNKDWAVRASKPRGKQCVECAAKAKPKATKKKGAKKKSPARKRPSKRRRRC